MLSRAPTLTRIPRRPQHRDTTRGTAQSAGRTKSRLVTDPERGPVVTQIFDWRTAGRLSIRAITDRLNADPAGYPSPAGTGWSKTTVVDVLRNPKYTGYMVFGRTRKTNGRARPVPRDQWIWSPAPSTRP